MDEVIYMPDEAKAKVRNLLNQLARLVDARTLREIDKAAAIHEAIPEDVRLKLKEIEEEYADHFEIVNANIAATEAELKAVGVFTGETVSMPEAGYQVVFSNGRSSYDTKAIEALSKVPGHEYLNQYRVEGNPSVSIRKIKRG